MGAVSVDRAPPGVLPVGAKLGRYEILGKLAAGGMAIVYVARAHGVAGFERLVAIKVLHSNLAHEEEFIKMFLDEARLAASIRHPNVVPTIDISDSEKSGYFIVMEYIEGDHLGQLLSSANKAGERLPIRVTLRIIGDALGGLGAAHDLRDEQGNKQNLVHRDVSPHNIMVGRDGVARLTDFGVAKAEDRLTHTRDGQVKGKLAYMAPEQAASGTTDTRSDLFSMGVILWECLTGQRLMRAESTAATLHKLLHGEIPKPSSILPELAPLDPVLEKALSRDPDQRYPTAEAFARALEDVSGAFAGGASLREVSKVVKHHAAAKLKRDKKLIDDALKALRPAGAPDGQRGIFTDEVSSPTSPSNSEISIVAGPPSIVSKVSSVSSGLANETMPGTRRATRRTLETAIGEPKAAPPPPPLGATLPETEPTKREELPIAVAPPLEPDVEPVTNSLAGRNEEPVTRNLLGNREPVLNEPPVVLSPLISDEMLQMKADSLPPPPLPVMEAPRWSEAPAPNRRLHIAVLAVGIAALIAVGVWAGSASQEVVQVQEMGAPAALELAPAAAQRSSLVTTAAPATPEPEPPRSAGDRQSEPVTAKAPEAQAIVPVVPSAAVSAPSSASTNARTRAAVRAVNASSASKPSVRRHRDSKPVPSHLDVIPNPYHD
jgi:eukaryotic-like serine/threonine-protein kinase